MRRPLLTELSAAGLLGVAVDKVTRCVAIPALLAVWEWRRQVGVSCAAKSSVSSLLCKKKDCSTWVLPSIAVLFVYSTLSVIAALCRFPLRPSCEKAAQPSPQAWLSCKIKMQFLELCAEQSGAHLKSFKSAVTPALPAAPARSRCSGTCRWNSAQRSGRTPLQCWRCNGGSCTAQCSPDAWEVWAAPCGQPCRFQ